VFEVLEMTEDVRHLIRTDSDSSTIDKAAMGAGMTTMIDDGVAKSRAGITSPAEVLRVATIR
jgi:general secretion pathway protein E